MKTITILTITAFLFAFTTTETKKQQYNNGQQKYQISTENGMLNGKYISWYKNGQKKAEGTFKNNQRTQTWTVWDSLGQVRMIRNYENSFQFNIITAKNEKAENISIPEKVFYNLTKNVDGFYEYPKLLEKNVLLSKRIWRTIEPNSSNNILFDNNRLFELILKNIFDTKKLIVYDTSSDEFKKELTVADVKSKIANRTFDIIGYKIKEDWFFDMSLQLSETRIIGLCPVIKDKNNGKQTDLFWIYYPELRGILASKKVALKGEPLISTVEDIFQFRYFFSNIYKESNIYDRKISDYKSGNSIKDEAERIEMEIIDMEHDIWIGLTKKK